MKKITKVLFSSFLIVMIAASIFIYWQYDNIAALINGLNNTSDELAEKMDTNRANLKSEVEKYVSEPITDISAEDEQKLVKGEMTVEDIADKYNLPLDYMKDSDVENDETNSNPDAENNETNNIPVEQTDIQEVSEDIQSDTKAIDKAISEGVSKMYALKAKFVNKLGEVERKVYDEYTSLPKEEQNKESKYKIIMSNLEYVAQLEQKCDDDVAKVLDDLEAELIELKGDTEIIKVLKDAYKQEKEIKKSYYLSLYNN
ncbi:MAG: hypothetical protein AB7V48_16975 [Sedimentibacter sp.]